MLRKFKIKGLYSFGNDLQEVDFTAKPKSRLANTKYEYNFNLEQDDRPMKSAVFFGQNASGKTNLFLGIEMLLRIIQDGFDAQKGEKLDSAINKASKDIELGIELSDNKNNVYAYNIVFTKEKVIKEKFVKNEKNVFQFEKNKLTFSHFEFQNKIIEKDRKNIKQTVEDFFSKKLFSRLSNNIFYSIKDLKFKEVQEFAKLTKKIKIYAKDDGYSKDTTFNFTQSNREYFNKNKDAILNMFKIMDNSIDDFNFKEHKKQEEKNFYRIFFVRNKQEFDCENESNGLKKIIKLAIVFSEIAKNGQILIIDELDSSISTMALIKIFNELINSKNNENGQLIVSSHNVLLFDVSFLNSQQIFLVEKDDKLQTIIHTYYDYDIRSEKKRAYIDYLKGHFDE